jgi:hypothetical protein
MAVAVSTPAAPVHVTPIHQHDCECCKFLGWADQPGHAEYEHLDVYVCTDGGREGEELILRYGAQGDYMSMPARLGSVLPAPWWRAGTALYRAWRGAGAPPDWVALAL